MNIYMQLQYTTINCLFQGAGNYGGFGVSRLSADILTNSAGTGDGFDLL